ncbi:MAG: hypothetical protein A2233_04415 [Candidatus Kerfeldbacteria bacterium RIFOXYA2_FULL_38_24]|uniref:Purine nucleoside phosphorylase n=1 Tax=Candidatus Kerfeldbacteria bacterium RIFOXYB2_FULL_38_14 TaxID=1798547 RepID=A0A1G2BB38_9BACT|nr:MAG: hypothetical protein A2233_04415 [Candidatus Kerfeldbacteria bacterium RIFOXYA2_FULL_38_24]OGY86342.1 MAG: hypothetical protein A2319_03015 [Candidatus Kerfeldbacteria bacterium RIFOXYB2_FULL_38_14]OGY89861.1 MAG: hypothetical protein A2458_05035 [Candidatus Kerfeldbacteria bacterium RIFOXYC2_FULL_38_9]
MLKFNIFAKFANVEHGIMEKGDKVPQGVVYGEQTHKDKAVWVTKQTAGVIKNTDALVSKENGIALGLKTADCVPILFFEPHANIIGAIHAGWRGTALEITRKTLEFLRMKPFNILVGIGPAICPNCFVVGKEVARQFSASLVQEVGDNQYSVDLWQANVEQCLEVGIPERNIEVMRTCTYETASFYSVRKGCTKTDRNISFIKRI